MTISSLEARGERFKLSSEEELPVSRLLGQNQQSKDTFFSSTFKV